MGSLDSLRPRVAPPLRRQVALCVALLAATKFADLATTFVALSYVPSLSESNAVVVAVIDAVGLVPGLTALGVIVVVAVVAATEWSATSARSDTLLTPTRVRLLGYVPFAVWNTAVAGHNATLILSAWGW